MSAKLRARRIQEAQNNNLLSTAYVPTHVLTFPFSRELDTANKSRLKRLFRGGQCLPHAPEYSIPAVVSPAIFRREWVTGEEDEGYPSLSPPEDFTLTCLRGQHRVRAAEELLTGEVTWLVKIYSSDIGDEAKHDLIDKYDSENPPDDGEFYYHIRLYSGSWGWEKRDTVLEARWLARWRGLPKNSKLEWNESGGHKSDALQRLLGNTNWVNALDAFRHIKALYSGLRIGSTGRVITLGRIIDLRDMVYRMATWWNRVFEGDTKAMERFDKHSLMALHGTAPGASEKQRRQLEGLVHSGEILRDFEPFERIKYFGNICDTSRTVLVPSLELLFQNLQYFEALKNCFTRLVPLHGRSLRSALAQNFHTVNETHESHIQVDELNMRLLRIDDDPFELAYAQLWLFALRNFVSMPRAEEPKKAGRRRDPADRVVLHRFSLLARGLGFHGTEIDELLSQDPDICIAKGAMDAARREPEWVYPDRERDAITIAAIFRRAQRAASELDPMIEEMSDSPRRYGRPYDSDHRRDRLHMFLPQMHRETESQPSQPAELSSFFIAKSLFSWLLGLVLKSNFGSEQESRLIPLHSLVQASPSQTVTTDLNLSGPEGEREIGELKEKIQRLTEEGQARSDSEIRTLRENQSLLGRLQETTRATADSQMFAAGLQAQNKGLSADIERCQAELEALRCQKQREIQELGEENQCLMEEVQALKEAAARAQEITRATADSQMFAASLQAQNKGLSAEIERCQAELEALRCQKQREIQELGEENQCLMQEVQALKEAAARASHGNETLTEETRHHPNADQQLELDLDKCRTENSGLRNTMAELREPQPIEATTRLSTISDLFEDPQEGDITDDGRDHSVGHAVNSSQADKTDDKSKDDVIPIEKDVEDITAAQMSDGFIDNTQLLNGREAVSAWARAAKDASFDLFCFNSGESPIKINDPRSCYPEVVKWGGDPAILAYKGKQRCVPNRKRLGEMMSVGPLKKRRLEP